MTSLQRCMAVLNGEVPDMLPVIPQSFMYAVETAGLKISDVNRTDERWPRRIFCLRKNMDTMGV